MHSTGRSQESASPASDWRWAQLSADERRLWTEWRRAHPDENWRPLCRAILCQGFRLPPTEAETAILWPLVDARPNDAAAWFVEAAKPQGELRLQPSWALILRALAQRWFALEASIPEDETPDWREVRADDSAQVLKRIGWFR
jgi:hypothetical protein